MSIPELAEQFRWAVIAAKIKSVPPANCLTRDIALADMLVCMLSDLLHKMVISQLGVFSSVIIHREFQSLVMFDIDSESMSELF